MSVAELLPLAAGETWLAVFGGLIPILGILAVGWIVIRASRNEENADGEDADR